MGYKMFGPQVEPDGRIRWQEWAPAASGLHLVGDFNQWEKPGLQFRKLEYGWWEISTSGRSQAYSSGSW